MEVTYLPVGKNGIINLEVNPSHYHFISLSLSQELEVAMRPETSLVSVMTVNNEIGVRQPVEEIGQFYLSLSLFLSH